MLLNPLSIHMSIHKILNTARLKGENNSIPEKKLLVEFGVDAQDNI